MSRTALTRALRLLPGITLCAAVALAAMGLAAGEAWLFGHAWLEGLVLAILLGVAVRTLWSVPEACSAGIGFSARTLLELAVMLLGATLSVGVLAELGPGLVLAIIAVVAIAIAGSFGIGRCLGLPWRMAMLVACGNSICGNSAIAATAPVIGADGEDVAASIAFTAILGVLVVLALPLLVPLLGLSSTQYGVLAGLTVYAVPQVLAATAPVGIVSVQIGTIVKLVRVLMLGPVILLLGLGSRRGTARPPLHRLVPWFILGFIGLAALRSTGFLPQPVVALLGEIAMILTILSMAALGLGVDLRVLGRAGIRVSLAASLSILALGGIGYAAIRLLGMN